MPFTFSHPAAVLPIRRYGVLSALVIGSIIPDFLYFIPTVPKSNFGHTLTGLFFFCIPAGLFCLWLFHTVLKRPLVSLLPEYHRRRILALAEDFRFTPLKRFAMIVFSILVGAITHIAWDSFTHVNGWAVKRWDFMREEIVFGSHYKMSVADLLQQLSTVTGVLFLVYFYFGWIRRTPPTLRHSVVNISPKLKVGLWCMFVSLATMPALYYFLQNPRFWLVHSRREFVGYSIVSGIKAMYIEIIAFSIGWHLLLKRQLTPKR